MLVVVDANILMKDWFLRDRKWEAASAAIEAGRLRLVLPQVARIEVVGGYRRHVGDKVSQVNNALRRSSSTARQAAEQLLAVYDSEMRAYPTVLDSKLRQIGFEVVDPVESDHLEIVERAVNRIPPFNDSGEGYRDTLIWLTALDQLGDEPFNKVTLLSGDAIFTKRQGDLRDELIAASDAEGDLAVVRSLAAIDFPGEYEDGSFDLSGLGLGLAEIEEAIAEALSGADITRWTPPGPDYADVSRVYSVRVAESTLVIRKRYGEIMFDVSAEAKADIDADVLIIHDGPGDQQDVRNMAVRWTLNLRWFAETGRGGRHLSDAGSVEIISIDERSGVSR